MGNTFLLNNSTIKCFEFFGGKCYVESAIYFSSRHLCNEYLESELDFFLGNQQSLCLLGAEKSEGLLLHSFLGTWANHFWSPL